MSDFIKQWGALAVVCSGLASLLVYIDRFETVAASEQKWQAHNQALACNTVADLRAEIRALEVKIELTDDLKKQEVFLRQIEQIRKEIARIDANGVC